MLEILSNVIEQLETLKTKTTNREIELQLDGMIADLEFIRRDIEDAKSDD